MIAAVIAMVATIIWLIAFLAYDRASQLDAWHTYNHWSARPWWALSYTPVLLASICVFTIISCLLMFKFGLLPLRLVLAFIIGLEAAAVMAPPGMMMLSRHRRELVANDRFCAFKEDTVQYVAFCVPVTVGFLVASKRKSPN